jgi:hypothetical protein
MHLQLGDNKLRPGIQEGESDPAIRHFIQRDRDMRMSLRMPIATSAEIAAFVQVFSPSGADFPKGLYALVFRVHTS